METLVRPCPLLSSLYRKDSPPKWREALRPSIVPITQALGSLNGSLGSSSPGGLPGKEDTAGPAEMDRKRGRVWVGRRTMGCSAGLRGHTVKSQVAS